MKQLVLITLACVCAGSFARADKPAATGKAAPTKVTAVKLPPKKGMGQKAQATAPVTQLAKPPTNPPVRGLASVSDSNSALEVRGQSRNLSMMLTLRNRKNDINFVKPRENYSNEIQNTSY